MNLVLRNMSAPSLPSLFNDDWFNNIFSTFPGSYLTASPKTKLLSTNYKLDKDEVRLSVEVVVQGETTEEQNKNLASQLRALADKIETKTEEPAPAKKEPSVKYQLDRG